MRTAELRPRLSSTVALKELLVGCPRGLCFRPGLPRHSRYRLAFLTSSSPSCGVGDRKFEDGKGLCCCVATSRCRGRANRHGSGRPWAALGINLIQAAKAEARLCSSLMVRELLVLRLNSKGKGEADRVRGKWTACPEDLLRGVIGGRGTNVPSIGSTSFKHIWAPPQREPRRGRPRRNACLQFTHRYPIEQQLQNWASNLVFTSTPQAHRKGPSQVPLTPNPTPQPQTTATITIPEPTNYKTSVHLAHCMLSEILTRPCLLRRVPSSTFNLPARSNRPATARAAT